MSFFFDVLSDVILGDINVLIVNSLWGDIDVSGLFKKQHVYRALTPIIPMNHLIHMFGLFMLLKLL